MVDYTEQLRREMIPAAGCTEPSAVALAAAAAAKCLGESPRTAHVRVSAYLYKNGMNVGIPGMAGASGLDLAAALGIVAAAPERGLQVLCGLDEDQKRRGLQLCSQVAVETASEVERVYAEVRIAGEAHQARAIVSGRHDRIVWVERDGVPQTCAESQDAQSAASESPGSVAEIHAFCRSATAMELSFLDAAIEMNMAIAQEGLSGKFGLGVGRNMMLAMESGMASTDVANRAIAYAAAAADARMAGSDLCVMSTAGSGNQGLTATLPVIVAAQAMNTPREEMLRALALSALITIHTKRYVGRLSALCGCAISAAIGTCAGIVHLMGGGLPQIEFGIASMVADISGMICDGAKPGCALKIATSVSAAFRAAWLAHSGSGATGKDGIVSGDVEHTLQNLGRLGEVGMREANDEILGMLVQNRARRALQ